MKLLYISYMRVLAMLMVVLYHCLCYYTPIWGCDGEVLGGVYTYLAHYLNSIHMPMFVMISGFLYGYLLNKGKYSDVKLFYINKIKRIVVPFIFWSLVVWALLSSKTYIKFTIDGASHLWFLGMLFLLYCIFHTLRSKWMNLNSKQSLIVLTALTFVSVLMIKVPSNPGFILYQTLSFMYIFYIGILLGRDSLNIRFGGGNLLIFSLIALVGSVFVGGTISRLIAKLLSPAICIGALVSAKNISFKQNKIITLLDSCSMGIYLLHHIIIQYALTFTIIKDFLNEHLWMPVAGFPVIVLVSMTITWSVQRIPYIKYIVG